MRKESTYYCPNYCGIERNEPITCPECGIPLMAIDDLEKDNEDDEFSPKTVGMSELDDDPTIATWGDESEEGLSAI